MAYKSSAVTETCDRLATIDMGQKEGAVPPFFGGGKLGPIEHNVAETEAYLHAKFHLDPSNRQHTNITDRQDKHTGQTMDRWYRVNRFYKWSPKNGAKCEFC